MSLSSHCVALIPVRDFRTGNSRLAQTLDENTRNLLGRWMLERVLKAVGNAERIDEIAVLSDSAEVLTLAGEYGAVGLLQESGGLNNDLEIGRSWARERNACSLLIVHGDLPFLTTEEVNELLQGLEPLKNPGRDIRIAPLEGRRNDRSFHPADRRNSLLVRGAEFRETHQHRAGKRLFGAIL